ncbi:DUF4352 domain-containing protein [Agrococcus terreus]|uniref:hypothetical protein n=1 Tax=Agrococcus terreus TaxID=574649 RepID=UPI00384BC73A
MSNVPPPSQPQQPAAPGYSPAPQAPTAYQGTPAYAPAPAPGGPVRKQRNTIGLIALIVAAVGFIFACIPGALIVGWILLPIAFVLSIVSFFMKDKGKGLGIAALIVSVVGTIVGVVVFFAVVAASFNAAFSEETEVVAAPVTEVEETDAEAEEADAAAAEGSRDNPLPLGSEVSSDEWTVTVDSYSADGNATVAAANQFNEAPAAGSHYEIVTYTVTYTGDESGFAMMVPVDLVTSGGTVIDTTETMAVLEDSVGLDELYAGASTTGSQAYLVPDGETVLIRVQPGMFADEVFYQP